MRVSKILIFFIITFHPKTKLKFRFDAYLVLRLKFVVVPSNSEIKTIVLSTCPSEMVSQLRQCQ